MKRICLLISSLFFFSIFSFGQSKMLLLGTGVSGCELKNENMSPMTYYGVGAHGYIGFIDTRPKGLHEFSFYGGASVTTPLEGSSVMFFFPVDFDYTYLRNAGELGATGIRLYGGGSLALRFAIRNHLQYSNNNFDMDHASSLALAAMAQRSVKLKKRDLDVQWRLVVPLVSVSIVPGFIGRHPQGFILNDDDKNWLIPLKSSELLSLGSFCRVISDAGVVWNFVNGNAMFVKYRWDFTQNTSGNYIADAKHAFSFGLSINLK